MLQFYDKKVAIRILSKVEKKFQYYQRNNTEELEKFSKIFKIF